MGDALIEGTAGAIGAVISLISTYPLLTVSTLKSVDARSSSSSGPSGGVSLVPGAVRDVITEAQKLGLAGLFAGLKPAVVGTAVSQGIYFSVYSTLRRLVVRRKLASQGRSMGSSDGGHGEGIGVGASILVASTAGWVNVLLTNPVWVVVTQLQAASRSQGQQQAGSFVAAVRQVWQESGWRGFWKGVLPSLVMVANPTVQFLLYEWLLARLLALRRGGRPGGKAAPLSVWDVFLMSALSKVGATLATYPMLVIKNRLQAMTRQTDIELQYAGVVDAVRRIGRAEGLAGYYKGMQVKLVQTVLAAALLMALKEKIYQVTKLALQGGGGSSSALPPPRPAAPLRAGRSG